MYDGWMEDEDGKLGTHFSPTLLEDNANAVN